jgi:hypothetical protein
MPSAMVAKRSSFGDFTPGNGRTRCVATSKQSGERCKRDAIGGEIRCRTHGGIGPAIRKARRDAKFGRKIWRSSGKPLLASMKIRSLCECHEPLITKALCMICLKDE